MRLCAPALAPTIVATVVALCAASPLAAQSALQYNFSIGAPRTDSDPGDWRRGLRLPATAGAVPERVETTSLAWQELRTLAVSRAPVSISTPIACPMPVQTTRDATAPMPVSRTDSARLERMPVSKPACTNPLFPQR